MVHMCQQNYAIGVCREFCKERSDDSSAAQVLIIKDEYGELDEMRLPAGKTVLTLLMNTPQTVYHLHRDVRIVCKFQPFALGEKMARF